MYFYFYEIRLWRVDLRAASSSLWLLKPRIDRWLGAEVKSRTASFGPGRIGYLMLSILLLRIIVGEQSHEAGVHNLLETNVPLNVLYSGLKILFGAIYLWGLKRSTLEIIGLIGFALLVRLFAEGTFTIALIAAMMGERVVQAAKTIK